MSQRSGSREEKNNEIESKSNSFAVKSDSYCAHNKTNTDKHNERTSDPRKHNNGLNRNHYREYEDFGSNGYDRRPQNHNNYYYRYDRPPQRHRDDHWGRLRPDNRPNKTRQRNSNSRQNYSTNKLVMKTNNLSINEDNGSPSKQDETEANSSQNLGHKREAKRDVPQEHKDLQQKLDELVALKSIFDENVLSVDEKELKGRFLAEPVLNSNKLIVVYNLVEQKNTKYDRTKQRDDYNRKKICDNTQTEEFVVKHLPPIELYFELSYRYPSKIHPLFLISCKWMTRSQLDRICEKLEDLYYESKMEVLYKWFSFLQNEVLTFLDIDDKLDITAIINKPSNRQRPLAHKSVMPRLHRGDGQHDRRATSDSITWELIQHLKNYNEFKEKETFNKSYFECNICFSFNMGEDCVVFPCKHINCKSCIQGFFSTHIKDGTVSLLKCPETDCQTKAPPNLVRELVSEELYKRYDRLMLDTLVCTLQDAYFCPRKACGALVMGDSDSSLAHCMACGFAFCKNCKLTYHGFDPCNMFRDPEQRKLILEKYQNGNSTERHDLEKLYGKKQLNSALEEMATEKWLENVAKRCPHCKASIEKSDGCNKMACWRCNTFFCWLCLKQLPVTQPYSHFNDPFSKCFNQLFQGVNFNIEDMFENDFD